MSIMQNNAQGCCYSVTVTLNRNLTVAAFFILSAYISGDFMHNWFSISFCTLGVAVAVSAMMDIFGNLVRNWLSFL